MKSSLIVQRSSAVSSRLLNLNLPNRYPWTPARVNRVIDPMDRLFQRSSARLSSHSGSLTHFLFARQAGLWSRSSEKDFRDFGNSFTNMLQSKHTPYVTKWESGLRSCLNSISARHCVWYKYVFCLPMTHFWPNVWTDVHAISYDGALYDGRTTHHMHLCMYVWARHSLPFQRGERLFRNGGCCSYCLIQRNC